MNLFYKKNILLLILAWLLFFPVIAQKLLPFRLQDTGQTGNYTSTPGEDKDFAINPQSFTDNGDGTITDNINGLMWQKVDGGEMTFENANTFCDNLVLGGHTDWRLPVSIELFSINNFSSINPALNTVYFPTSQAQYWWTSEPQVNDPLKIWVVSSGGGIGPRPKTETLSAGGTKRFHVRAVRDLFSTTFSVSRFNDNSNGTITDNYTGLVWQKIQPSNKMTWEEALAYSNSLSLAEKTDWRLPDIKELQSLNDVTLSNPSLNTTFFPNILSGNFWSSTTLYQTDTKAWAMNVSLGVVSQRDKIGPENVLVVRGGLDNAYLRINEVEIPGGIYEMGDHFGFVTPGHPSDEIPIHTVSVDTFYMTNTEITNHQFLAFLNIMLLNGSVVVQNNIVYLVGDTNKICFTNQYSAWYSISYNGNLFSIADYRSNHPMVGVLWHGAVAYCNWLSLQNNLEECYTSGTWVCDFTKNGYRLPTEAEWEYAGRGGHLSPYFNYPNGNTINITEANLPGSGDPYETGFYPLTTPVGFYDGTLKQKTEYNWPGSSTTYQTSNGVNGYGLYDMQGNVWELINDWYGTDYYNVSPEDNPTGPTNGSIMPDGKPYRGMRGGNWYNGLIIDGLNDGHSRISNRDPSYYRGPQDPDHPWYHVGFRVARKSFGDNSPGQTQNMGLIINDTTSAFQGYTLFAPKHNTMTYLINNEGRKINEWNTSTYHPGQSVYLLENGHLLRTCMLQGQLGTGGGEGGRIEEYDWDDNLVWQFDFSTTTYMQHHDVKKLPNGNIIMLVVEKKMYADVLASGFDPSHLSPEISQKGFMLPDCVVEIQPTYPSGGTIVWEWHVWDHLIQDYDATKSNYGVVASHPELIDADGDHKNLPVFWNHMNSIDYNPTFDQIVLSVRGNSEAWIIDHSTTTVQAASHTGGNRGKGGDLLYRWGNPICYGAGTISNQKYFQQHDVEWVKPDCPGAGNLTCFNNGVTLNYSTIDEIIPPVDAFGNYSIVTGSPFGPLDFTWRYQGTPPESFYSENISGAQRLPNGNTLICEGGHGDFTEVTPTGDIVWKYICPVDDTAPMVVGDTIPEDPTHPGETKNAVFRIYRYPADYAAFTGKDLTPGDFIEVYPDSLQLLLEGLYNGGGTLNAARNKEGAQWSNPVADKIDVEFHDAQDYDNVVYTVSNVCLNKNGIAAFFIPSAYRGSYYIAVKHRNSIKTVTAAPVSFAAGTIHYDFTDQSSRAFGNNQEITIDGKAVIFTGDVNQDELVDGSDLNLIVNQNDVFATGYMPEDVNGDGLVDGSDLAITSNNNDIFVRAITP